MIVVPSSWMVAFGEPRCSSAVPSALFRQLTAFYEQKIDAKAKAWAAGPRRHSDGLEVVARLKFASVGSEFLWFLFGSGGADGPAQIQRWSEWEYHWRMV